MKSTIFAKNRGVLHPSTICLPFDVVDTFNKKAPAC